MLVVQVNLDSLELKDKMVELVQLASLVRLVNLEHLDLMGKEVNQV